MRLLFLASVLCLVLVVSAKKHYEENVDSFVAEGKEHSAKKYHKDHQKSHHHVHKHKKQAEKEQPVAAEPKTAPVEIPEPEIELQGNIETSQKNVVEQRHRDQTEDLHLQDLTYEENLNKEKKKKKKNHHAAPHAKVVEHVEAKKERKLFSEQEELKPVDEKVIEDSFEPLKESVPENKKGKQKDKKQKDKSKNKKASEKYNKDKNKKSKDGKKKNKDKKNKNKDKKKW